MTAKISSWMAAVASILVMAAVAFAVDLRYDNFAELRIGNFYMSALIVDRVPELDIMEQLFRQSLPSIRYVSVIRAFPDKISATTILGGKGHSDASETERDYLQRAATVDVNMGEIVNIGMDTLIRSVHNGVVEQKVLRGKDPLTCPFDLAHCKIIWLNVRDVPPLLRSKFTQPLVELFLTADRIPTIKQALEASKILDARFHTNLLVVTFRSDEWFINRDFFPPIYPFMSPRHLMEPKQSHLSSGVSCSSLSGEMHCGADYY